MAELSLPISERMHAEVLSLPIGPQMTDAQLDRVIDAVLAATAREVSLGAIA
jgi:dTDP-4-amino-4,6-dideoxygalactose transaminase